MPDPETDRGGVRRIERGGLAQGQLGLGRRVAAQGILGAALEQQHLDAAEHPGRVVDANSEQSQDKDRREKHRELSPGHTCIPEHVAGSDGRMKRHRKAQASVSMSTDQTSPGFSTGKVQRFCVDDSRAWRHHTPR